MKPAKEPTQTDCPINRTLYEVPYFELHCHITCFGGQEDQSGTMMSHKANCTKCGWHGHSERLSAWTQPCWIKTQHIGSKKNETAVHGCNPAISVLVVLVSHKVYFLCSTISRAVLFVIFCILCCLSASQVVLKRFWRVSACWWCSTKVTNKETRANNNALFFYKNV